MAKSGAFVGLAGVILLVAVLVHTLQAIADVDRSCPAHAKAPTDPDAVLLYSAPKTFGVNDYLCIAWKPTRYFDGELQLKQRLADLKKQAAGAAAPAGSARSAGAAPVADAALNAQLQDAQAKVDAIPANATVYLFIDNTQTQASFAARVPEPGEKEEWVWQGVPLSAEEKHDTDTARLWRSLLAGVNHKGNRSVTIGLGDDKAKLPRKDFEWGKALKISAYQFWWLIAAAAGFLATMAGVIMIGWRTPMLRVRTPAEKAPDGKGPDKPPFSLGRVQMMWWFILVLAGFLFIWLTTGQWAGVMTASVVGLLGISGASGLAAVAIDGNEQTGPQNFDLKTIQTGGFLFDLLADGNNIVLHRVQMVAWTLVLGLIFIWSVLSKYSFPEFDPTLLTLSGLVSGLYLGFKFPENRGATSNAPKPSANGGQTDAGGGAGDNSIAGGGGDDTIPG